MVNYLIKVSNYNNCTEKDAHFSEYNRDVSDKNLVKENDSSYYEISTSYDENIENNNTENL